MTKGKLEGLKMLNKGLAMKEMIPKGDEWPKRT